MMSKIATAMRHHATLYIICALASIVSPLCLLTSCSDDTGGGVKIGRLDLALRSDSLPFGSDLCEAADRLFALSGYGTFSDSVLSVYNRNPSIRIHDRAMDSIWNDLSLLEAGLGRLKSNFNKLFPDDRFPAIYAVVSPFNQSVFTTDTILFLGLNHYFGEDYSPYGYFADYIRRRKTPERVLPDVAETIVRGSHPYLADNDEYPTVISRLLYEGAVVEAVMQLTGMSERDVLGYDKDEMAWAEANERRVWQTMAERKMIFSTDDQLAAMLVNLAPFTSAINPEAPGAIGRFIGHRIVSSYLDRHAKSLSWVLVPDFYHSQSALSDSGYN